MRKQQRNNAAPRFYSGKNYILQHKLLSLLAICVIGITLTLGLRHLSNQSTSKKAVMKPIVHTQVVSRRPLYKSITLFGQLKAKAQIDIVNKYAGIVDEINVDLGSKVQAGDILLVQHLMMPAPKCSRPRHAMPRPELMRQLRM